MIRACLLSERPVCAAKDPARRPEAAPFAEDLDFAALRPLVRGFGLLLFIGTKVRRFEFDLLLIGGSPSVLRHSRAATTEAPPRPSGRRGGIPKTQLAPGMKHSTAPTRPKCQSFWSKNIADIPAYEQIVPGLRIPPSPPVVSLKYLIY